jgi:hypothetical protein
MQVIESPDTLYLAQLYVAPPLQNRGSPSVRISDHLSQHGVKLALTEFLRLLCDFFP